LIVGKEIFLMEEIFKLESFEREASSDNLLKSYGHFVFGKSLRTRAHLENGVNQ
jgi:hypothetical protein